MRNYDLIVIGSGPAGEKGAAIASHFGKNVALIQREVVPGGACVNTGTIPSKTLRESAMHLSGFRQRGLYSIDQSVRDNITIGDFLQRKREVVEKEWDMIDENMRWHGIDRYRGIGRFISPHEVVVDTPGYDITLHGEYILIATGSSPHHPEDVPFDNDCIYDSDTILELDRIPNSMVVVGAGVIGAEYATIFAALGIKVTLIDGRTELLGHVDREIVDILLRQMKNRLRINLLLGEEVESVEVVCNDGEENAQLKLKSGRTINTEKVLYAAGRQSNVEEMNLDVVGVQTGKRGVLLVDENYRTNVPHIYGAGDVIGFPALASTSMEQARVAMVNAFGLQYETSLAPLVPYGIWTIPELSMVGKSEEELLQAGIDYECGRAYYRNNPRGQIMGDTAGMIKLLFDPQDHTLLGIHIIGDDSAELIHIGMMVMQLGGKLEVFVRSAFNYPTLSDIYKQAAEDGLRRLRKREEQKTAVMLQADEMSKRYEKSSNGIGHDIEAAGMQADAPTPDVG